MFDTRGDGYLISSAESTVVPTGEVEKISTGLKLFPPVSQKDLGLLRPAIPLLQIRNEWLTPTQGGELIVECKNEGNEDIDISPEDPIAFLVFIPFVLPTLRRAPGPPSSWKREVAKG